MRLENEEKVYIVGINDPERGTGYIDRRVFAGNFTLTTDLEMAREFPTREKAQAYADHINNLLKFEEILTAEYVVLEYTKSVVMPAEADQ